ncbi:MAG: macro domain-containing protein [bacterium]|nr:macro domain-containing protein [bacterium]
MEINYLGVKIEVVKGDITEQSDIEAVVNAANADLKPGGGVAGAIHRKAGKELYEECKKYAPIKAGEAVITKAYKLPNRYVIHCLGPIYGVDKPENKILEKCYKNALKLCEENKIVSIAFPSISTGAFGYPISEAVGVVFNAIREIIPNLKFVKVIRFVLFSDSDYEVYKKTFEKLVK